MSKTLIVALALSLVLVSGSLYSARADCGLSPCCWSANLYPCNWHLTTCGWHWPSCFSCCNSHSKDMDRPNMDKTPAPNDRNMDKGQY
jgi:hypothetical protein